MKLPLSWIKEFIDLPESPEEISDALTLAGLEVDGLEDGVFDIGLTPNLGHCMSVVGVARELSAILDRPLKPKEVAFEEGAEQADVKVEIKDPSVCSRYSCRVVKGVVVPPSPDWLKERLEECGQRSVNALVDIGNFVMLEMGQPMHVFDLDRLEGNKIAVDVAKGLDSVTTLDDVERKVVDESLVICDGKGVVAFGGVMGEKESSVSENTHNVLIEAALFSPEAVRKTSKLLNLRSESSLRFERGVDPLGVEVALDQAAQMIQALMGGTILKGRCEATGGEYTPHKLTLDPERANALLGLDLSVREMVSLLERLEIKLISEGEDGLLVQVPSYRNDLRAEIDLVEEVGRMHGFNHIPRGIPRHASSTLTHAPLYVFEEEVRDKLVASGLQECLTCDLISPKMAELTGEKAMKDAHIHVLHPASIDQSVLRTTLLPGLLEMVKYNLDHQNPDISAFEVGHVHFMDGKTVRGEPAAGIILSGRAGPYYFEGENEGHSFYTLKGHVENLLASLGINGDEYRVSHLDNFQPGRQAELVLEGQRMGALGEVHPAHLREVGINHRVYYAEINLHDLMNWKKSHTLVKKLASFPGSERDWTVSLKMEAPVGIVLAAVEEMKCSLLEKVFLLDLYKSDKIGKDRKNATFRFLYRDPKKTIEYAAVEKEHKLLLSSLEEKLKDHVP